MRKVVIESKYFLNILFYDSYSFLRRSSNLVTIFNFTKKKKRSQRYTILTLKLNQTQFKISIRAHKKNQFTLSIPTWFPPRAACYFLQFIAHFLSKFPSLATFIKISLAGYFYPNSPHWPLSACRLPSPLCCRWQILLGAGRRCVHEIFNSFVKNKIIGFVHGVEVYVANVAQAKRILAYLHLSGTLQATI